jgi:hypothetical protein
VSWYRIIIKERLDCDWACWFDGMTLSYDERAQATTLCGAIADQAALLGVLNKIHGLGLTLAQVQQVNEETTRKMVEGNSI